MALHAKPKRAKSFPPRKSDLPVPDERAIALEVSEAAALARVSFHHLYRAINKGELPAYQPGDGKPICIFRDDVIAWIKATPYVRRRKATSAEPAERKAAARKSNAAKRETKAAKRMTKVVAQAEA